MKKTSLGRVRGGWKARDILLARDPDYYAKIGAKGGKHSNNGGFAHDIEKTRIIGQIGGLHRRKGGLTKANQTRVRKLRSELKQLNS